MAIISNIPEEYISSLKLLVSIEREIFNELVSLIENSPIVFSPFNIAKPLDKYSVEEIKSILITIGSLFPVRERKAITSTEVAEDICRFIKEKDIKELSLNLETEQILKARITTLLESEKFYLSSKPIDILSEYENIFLSSRAITDIRPVFGSNIEKSPKAAMIIHSLHIHYRHGDEGDNHKDIYFALDSKDLTDLMNILERAEKKSKTLQSMLEKNEITNLDTTQGE